MQDQPFFKCTIDGETYEIEKLTLGEARTLRRKFELEDLSAFDLSDPDYIAALLFAAHSRKHPEKPEAELDAFVDQIDLNDVMDGLVSAVTPEDPQTPAEEGGENAAAGGQETTPGPSGSPA